MKYAQMSGNIIDVISLDPKIGDGWEPVPDNVFGGFEKQSDGSFLAPTQPLAELKTVGKQSVLEFAEMIGSQLTVGYPLVEREAWITKLAEARAIVAGETDTTKYPVIASEISVTGILAADVAPVIIFKAGLFETASGLISGMRQKTNAAIDLATNQTEIDAILAAAKIEAQTALASLLGGS